MKQFFGNSSSGYRLAVRTILLVLISALTALSTSLAQDTERAATEERLNDLRHQIEQDQRRLAETTEAEQATLSTLETLDREISLRQELLETYRRHIREIESESDSLRSSMAALERDLNELREQYQSRVRHAYMYGRMHDLALILSASSINQMLVRARYLNRFSAQRRERLEQIRKTTQDLEARGQELAANLSRNEELLRETELEQRNLTRLQSNRRQVVNQLRGQRTAIQAELERKRASARDLENRIRQLVARDASPAREPAFDAAAYAALSGSFRDNQGRLPWPSRGVIREPFGDIVNPVYGTSTPNPGVLIDTRPQAEVRSVFEGVVVDVDVMPDYGTIVVIQHGEYRSVYSNFSVLYVQVGDIIEAGHLIGRSGTDVQPKGAALFFAIFRNGQAIDPAPWLQRM